MNFVKINGVYRHFKGNYYYVVDVAKDSETQERMVVYKQLYTPGDTFVRKESMFLEKIPPRPDNVTGQTYRFELQEQLEKNYLV